MAITLQDIEVTRNVKSKARLAIDKVEISKFLKNKDTINVHGTVH